MNTKRWLFLSSGILALILIWATLPAGGQPPADLTVQTVPSRTPTPLPPPDDYFVYLPLTVSAASAVVATPAQEAPPWWQPLQAWWLGRRVE